jgi:hypothetical protein
MTSSVRRITVSLPREQIKSLKNVSKMLKTPVSTLVSDLIGEAVTSFEELVIHRDIEGAKKRVASLTSEASRAISEVENVKLQ